MFISFLINIKYTRFEDKHEKIYVILVALASAVILFFNPLAIAKPSYAKEAMRKC